MRTGFLAAVVFVAANATMATAQVEVSFEAPGVKLPPSAIPSGNISTFDGVTDIVNYGPNQTNPPGSSFNFGSVGTYATTDNNGMTVRLADVNGGAGGSSYFVVNGQSSATLTFNNTTGVGYFGMYVTAGDDSNRLTFQKSNSSGGYNTISTFAVEDLRRSGQLQPYNVGGIPGENSHYGNPETGANPPENTGEVYVYLNFYAETLSDKFDRVVFTQTGTGGFESDNHAYFDDLVSARSGTLFVSPVPEPAGLLALAALGLGVVRRFRG